MKKLVVVAAIAALFASAVFGVDFAIGAKGNANFNLGLTLDSDVETTVKTLESTVSNVKKGTNIGGGFGGYANIGFINTPVRFGLQPEVNMNFNNGYHFHGEGTESGVSYTVDAKIYTHTLDIPILAELEFPVGNAFALGFGIGPQLSIPVMGDYTQEVKAAGLSVSGTQGVTFSSSGVNFGLALDANGKIFFGDSKDLGLVFDFRYNLDFSPTKFKMTYTYDGISETETQDMFTRRGLNIGLGFEARL